jgi:alpha-tubulin suppressor-like RCC1 family protein
MLITTEGLFACGEGGSAELGLGDEGDTLHFEKVAIEGVPLSVAFGSDHTMVITTAGLFACGSDMNGELGLGGQDRTTFTRVMGVNGTPLHVACGYYSTLLFTTEGLYGTGNNGVGQLGFGNEAWHSSFFWAVANPPPGIVLSLACSESHTMLLTTKALFGCGVNSMGELGLSNTAKSYAFEEIWKTNGPRRISDEEPILVACGNRFTMLLTKSGLLSVGHNAHGELGIGKTKSVFKKYFRDVGVELLPTEPYQPSSPRYSPPPEKKRRLGSCHLCDQSGPTMRQEVSHPDRLFCSLHCQKRYHWFGRALSLACPGNK